MSKERRAVIIVQYDPVGNTMKNKGTWKKERATRRKFSAGDEHHAPKAGTHKQYWVGNYHRNGRLIKGHFRTNPHFRSS